MHLLFRATLSNTLILLSACWARSCTLRVAPGLPRLLTALPVVAINLSVPLLFHGREEFITHACYLLLLTWLGNFKVLALALNRGPLCKPLSLLQFVAFYGLPITPQLTREGGIPRMKSNNRFHQSAGTYVHLAQTWAVKMLLVGGVVWLLSTWQDRMPVILKELAQAFMLYWFLGVLMDGPAAFLSWGLGVSLSPHFDKPYLATSLSDFWSKRWNLTVGNSLRALCYDPIHEGRLIASEASYKPRKLRSAMAVCWTFVASGLMHELLIGYINPKGQTGHWLAFFSLQGPLVILESYVKKHCGFKLPRWCQVLTTISLLLLVGHYFFFPPVIGGHLDQYFFDSVKELARLPLRYVL